MAENEKLKVCVYRERTRGYIVAFSDGSCPVYCRDMAEVVAEFEARSAKFFEPEASEDSVEEDFDYEDPDSPDDFSGVSGFGVVGKKSVNSGKVRHEGLDLTEFGKKIPCLSNIYAMRDPRRSMTPVNEWVRMLKDSGITQLIDLTEETYSAPLLQVLSDAGISYFSIPVKDFTCPTREQVGDIVLKTKDPEKKTVIHCGAGKGRTGTVVSCIYATRDEDATGDYIIERVREARLGSVETAEQENFVEQYILFVDSLREPKKDKSEKVTVEAKPKSEPDAPPATVAK